MISFVRVYRFAEAIQIIGKRKMIRQFAGECQPVRKVVSNTCTGRYSKLKFGQFLLFIGSPTGRNIRPIAKIRLIKFAAIGL